MSMIKFNSQTIKSIATSISSCAKLLSTSADRATDMIDNVGSAGVHVTAMLDDLAADGHDATTISGKFNALERRVKFTKKYKDADFAVPKELLAPAPA